MLEFLVDNIFVAFAGKVFQQIVGIPMGTNCAPLLADIFLYSYEAEFIQSLLSTSWRLGSISHTGTSMMFCPLTTQSLRITWARCIPLNSRSKTRQRATLLLHTWIYFCRSGGTVNFTLPFMTNVTISISTSQLFRSWVAIFQPRPPMASLFRSLYGMPGFDPRMDVLSWGRHDFQITFSNRDTSRKSSLRKFYGRYRGLIKQYEVSISQMLNDILWPDHIQWQPPLIRLCTELDLLPNFEWFP